MKIPTGNILAFSIINFSFNINSLRNLAGNTLISIQSAQLLKNLPCILSRIRFRHLFLNNYLTIVIIIECSCLNWSIITAIFTFHIVKNLIYFIILMICLLSQILNQIFHFIHLFFHIFIFFLYFFMIFLNYIIFFYQLIIIFCIKYVLILNFLIFRKQILT